MSDMAIAAKQQVLMPQTVQDKLTMAKQLAESGLMPQGLNSPQKVFVALQWGHELGLSPMVFISNIAVINGRPTLGADIMFAIVRAHPEEAGQGNDAYERPELRNVTPVSEEATFALAERAGGD